MYLPATSNSPLLSGMRPLTSPYVQPMCRCIDVSATIIPAPSPPHVPIASGPSEGGRLVPAEQPSTEPPAISFSTLRDRSRSNIITALSWLPCSTVSTRSYVTHDRARQRPSSGG